MKKNEALEGNNVIRFFIERPLLVWMLMSFLLLAGIMSLLTLRRESFPNVDLHEIKITTVYPGASPADVEQFVTIPIEDKIREVENIDQIRSISRHSVSEIDVRIDLDASDPQKYVDDVRRAVQNVGELPDLVTEPSDFQERKSSNFPVLEVALFGDVDEHKLQSTGRLVEEELEKVPGVSRVDVFAQRDREWRVMANPYLMRQKSISLSEINQAIRNKNVNIPGGTFSQKKAINLRTTGEFESLKDLKQLPVRSNDLGYSLVLDRIADFEDTYEDPQFLARVNGQRAVSLVIIKKSSADQIILSQSVKERLASLEKVIGDKLKFQVINDEASRTLNRLDVVTSNAMVGFILVLLVLMVFLTYRDAVITSISLPLTILASVLVFPVFDITFNLISMLGLIVSLGMLVDNSIVISENIYRYKEKGLEPNEAAIRGTSELIIPIIGTYLTTIAAFMPMMFMSGIMGKFIWQIPFLVIVTLTASLIESFFLLPTRVARYGAALHSNPAPGHGLVYRLRAFLNRRIESLANGFKSLVTLAVDNRYKTLGLIFLLFVGAIVLAGAMKFTLFPKENSEAFIVKIEYPPHFKIEDTMERMQAVEQALQKIPKEDMVSYVIKAGVQQINAQDVLSRYGDHLAMAQVFLTPQLEREKLTIDTINELMPDFKAMKDITDLRVEEIVPAPPIGAAITIAVEGRDYESLQKIAAEVTGYLETIKGVKNIAHDYKPGRDEVVVRLRDDIAARAGIDTMQAANIIRTAYEGSEVSTLRQGKEEINIRVKFKSRHARNEKSLGSIQVRNQYGLQTPLGSVIKYQKESTPESLSHFNFERAITVTADVDEKVITSGQANEKVFEKFANLEQQYPGYRLALRGEQENTKKSMASLGKAAIIAMFAIFGIIAIIFNSLLRPLFIIGTIPLGLIGVVIGFLISGKALSFFAMIGIIGLAGVVVNASIVLVDFINREQEDGLDLREAVIEAAKIRFRPILLTTTTTLAGLLPTAYGLGGSDPVLIPMTLALAWGLAAGTMAALIVIPVLLLIALDLQLKMSNLFSRSGEKVARRRKRRSEATV